jgi:hypothetical protein
LARYLNRDAMSHPFSAVENLNILEIIKNSIISEFQPSVVIWHGRVP